MSITVRIQQEDFCLKEEHQHLTLNNTSQGAVVSFVGTVRSDHPDLIALNIEHYPVMTEQQIQSVVNQAMDRWSLLAVTVIHRIGELAIGDNIVLILVSSEHRKAAFEACDFIMDYLKMKAPFWKQTIYHENSDMKSHWIDAKESDKKAFDTW